MLIDVTREQNDQIIETLFATWRSINNESRDIEFIWAREASEILNYPVSTYLAIQAWVTAANLCESIFTESIFHLLTAYKARDYLAELLQYPDFLEAPLASFVQQTDLRFYASTAELTHALFGGRRREGDIERPWYWRAPRALHPEVVDEMLDSARVDDSDVEIVRRLATE